jgi:Tol biopolymer transport system component
MIYAIVLIILLINCSKSPTEPDPLSTNTILFIHGNVEVNEICTMKPDGSEINIIATAPPRTYLPTNYPWARLSPDGNTLIVQGGIRESLEYDPLYIMDTEGNILYKLTWNGDRPYWMSDGEHIIYTRRRGYFSQTYDVYKINIHSRTEEMIMESEYEPAGPNSFYNYRIVDVHPLMDSKLLLNEILVWEDSTGKEHDDDTELIFYDTDTQTKTYLTNNEKWEGPARISPNGNQIAYGISHSVRAHVHYQIHMMTIDGDSLGRVTTESEVTGHHYYTWSPDGNYLAYTKADQSDKSYNEYNDIYIMNIHTREEKQITFSGSESDIYRVMEWR